MLGIRLLDMKPSQNLEETVLRTKKKKKIKTKQNNPQNQKQWNKKEGGKKKNPHDRTDIVSLLS